MTDREIMQQALEAFEDLKKSVTRDGTVSENWDAYYEKEYYALEALRQALAQPEQTKCPQCNEVNPAEIHTCSPQVAQEPVACVKKLNAMIIGCVDVINEDGVHEDAKKLAKLVKKDCYEILQNLEEKT